MSSTRLELAAVALLSLSACTNGSGPTTPFQDGTASPLAAPPGSTQPVSLDWVVDDLSGVASDGRGIYSDGVCGVGATLNSTVGHLIPADTRSRCGYVRTVSVNLGTSLVSAIKQMGAIGIDAIPAGNVGSADFNVQTGLNSCAILRYNAETGTPVRVTASLTGSGKHQWLVESVSPHLAGCYASYKNGFVWDGVQRTVALRVTITAR